jgi:hypothetical protein
MMVATVSLLVSVYVVEQLPEESSQTDWLKLPVPLVVLQVTLPVGLDPDTIAVQTTDEEPETMLDEHRTEAEVTVLRTKSAVIPPFPFIVAATEGKYRSDKGMDTGPLASQVWKTCVESGLAVRET